MKKVVVITGGNSGLGKETARILVSRHHKVVIWGKNVVGVAKATKELKCLGLICDVRAWKDVKNACALTLKKYGRIDCLVNCAGAYITGPIEKNDVEDIKNLLLTNVLGPMLTVRAVAPHMKKRRSGRIVNVVSKGGLYAKAARSVYYSSKWALTGFTECLHLDLAPFGISVSGFYPGFMKTGIFKSPRKDPDFFRTAMSARQAARELVHLIEADNDLVIKKLEVHSLRDI